MACELCDVSQVQSALAWCNNILQLLEAHVLGESPHMPLILCIALVLAHCDVPVLTKDAQHGVWADRTHPESQSVLES